MKPNSPEQEIDRSYLTDLVRRALDRPKLELTTWNTNSIQGGVEFTSAVYRFKGEARDDGETIPWSLILKAIRPAEKSQEPGGIWYWKREALAYQSGMLHGLPGGDVIAPTCFEVQERPDGSIWLWLEDVKEDVGTRWTVEQYAIAARHLGRFNGAYLTGQAIPSELWIPHNWLRMYVENAAPAIAFMHREPHHPLIERMYPGIVHPQVLALWDERQTLLKLLEGLPQVFCHQDAFRRNLFARGGKTVAIDWGYMGNAPVGAELVALVAASLGFWEIPAERVLDLDRLCFEGYLQGLRDAGWSGDPKVVRTGYNVTLMLRYPVGAQTGELLPALLDQERRAKWESAFEDKTAEDLEKSDPAIVAYYEKMMPESMKLIGMTRMIHFMSRIGIHSLRLRKK